MTDRTLGEKVHDWGVGLGTFALGAVAIAAAFQTKDILNEIFKIQEQSKSINDAVHSMAQAESDIKKAVEELTKITISIQSDLKKLKAKSTVAKLPPNPSQEEIQNTLNSLKKSADTSVPYLTNEAIGAVSKAWNETKDPQKKEEILYNALQIGVPINHSNEMKKDTSK